MKKSRLFIQKIKTNAKLIALREFFYKIDEEDFNDEVIHKTIKDLIKHIDNTYFPLPGENIELEDEDFIMLTKYRNILD